MGSQSGVLVGPLPARRGTGVKLLRFDGGVSLRLDVAGAATPPTAPSWTVRAVTRAELETTSEPLLECSISICDELAPQGWRCIAVFEGGRVLHRSFVDLRAGRPLLFAVETHAQAR